MFQFAGDYCLQRLLWSGSTFIGSVCLPNLDGFSGRVKILGTISWHAIYILLLGKFKFLLFRAGFRHMDGGLIFRLLCCFQLYTTVRCIFCFRLWYISFCRFLSLSWRVIFFSTPEFFSSFPRRAVSSRQQGIKRNISWKNNLVTRKCSSRCDVQRGGKLIAPK